MTKALVREVMEALAPDYGLSERAVELLVVHARHEHHVRGTRVTPAADDAVGIVLSGIVRVACERDEADVTVQLVGPRRVFHLGAPVAPPGRPALHVGAHVDADVALLPAAGVAALLGLLSGAQQVAFLERACRALSSRLALLCALHELPLADRLLLRLEELARDFGVAHPAGIRVDVPLTHHDLARLVAASRPNVTRAFTRLEGAGRVQREGGRIVLPGRRTPDAGRRHAGAPAAERRGAASSAPPLAYAAGAHAG